MDGISNAFKKLVSEGAFVIAAIVFAAFYWGINLSFLWEGLMRLV